MEEREKEREGRERRKKGKTYLYASQDLGDVGVMVCKHMEEQLSSVEPHRAKHSPSMAW